MDDTNDAAERAPTPGASPRAGGNGYQSGSEEQQDTSDRYQPGSDGQRSADGYSDGYQSGSEEPPPSGETPHPQSQADDEPMDPYVAYARAAAKERERKKREQEPAIWLPESDQLAEDPGLVDGETRFNRDGWGGRGNPQVSVRLRPRDFERLSRAADLYGVPRTTFARMMVIRGVGAVLDAELRRKAEFLGDPEG